MDEYLEYLYVTGQLENITSEKQDDDVDDEEEENNIKIRKRIK